ncbi:MAG TPA: glycosyltransferase family 2 protein [Candidatus Limnocylindria bacterium]|nr:glycosyltransferase family 2 protein [Candidatus Limnocylindria bacterium]
MTRVSVIIVSFEVRDLLRACLKSVRLQRGVEVEVWVVDNASRDGSASMVAKEFPEVRVIPNQENLGFPRASNQAMARATGDMLLLLNPDTELPAGSLRELGAVFGRHSSAGAVGFALETPFGKPQPACHSFPGVVNLLIEALGLHRAMLRVGFGTPTAAPIPGNGEGEVDWVGGACMALSRDAYHRVGGLNEKVFMYGEEMDWSWRAKRLGLATVFSNRVSVIHHGGASGEGLRGSLFIRVQEARLLFLRNHRGQWLAAVAREIAAMGALLRLTYWAPRAWIEALLGGVQPWTRAQNDRFRAVLAWRLGMRS